jgi:hypothetical protein
MVQRFPISAFIVPFTLVASAALGDAPTLSFSQAISMSSQMNGGEDGTSQGTQTFAFPLPMAPITDFRTRFVGTGSASIGCDASTGACGNQIGVAGGYTVWPTSPGPTGSGNPGIGVFADFTYNAPGGDRYEFDQVGRAGAPFFYGPGNVGYTARHFIGGFSGLTGSGRVDGVFTQTFTFDDSNSTADPTLRPTIIRNLTNSGPFSDHVIGTSDQGAGPIGAIQSLNGGVTVRRADGSMEAAAIGMPIFFGDEMESGPGQSVNILFVDGTTLAVPQSSQFKIDEYVYDPVLPSENGENFLERLIRFSTDIIGRDDPDVYELDATCCDNSPGSLGFRGDSEAVKDAIRNEILNNPAGIGAEGFIGTGALFTAASPVSLTSYIQTLADPFDLIFDYMFLDPDMNFSVALGGIDLFQTTSDAIGLNMFENFMGTFDWGSTIADLTFTFDGPTGSRGLLSNLSAPGLDLLDTSRWFISEGNSIDYVAFTDDAGLRRIGAAVEIVAPIPLPASFFLLLAGLSALFLLDRRRRSTVS